jgi:hypothetical protein
MKKWEEERIIPLLPVQCEFQAQIKQSGSVIFIPAVSALRSGKGKAPSSTNSTVSLVELYMQGVCPHPDSKSSSCECATLRTAMSDSLHFASNVSAHKKQEENRGQVVALTDSNTLQNFLNFFLNTLLHGTYGATNWGAPYFSRIRGAGHDSWCRRP